MVNKIVFVLVLGICIFSVEFFVFLEKYFKRCEKKCCFVRNKCMIESWKEDIKDI